MVPLSTLTRFESRPGPEFTLRYNLYRSAQIIGSAAPGYSSAQAMAALEEVFAETMPPEMGYDYLGISFQEKRAQQGVSPTIIFGFSLLVVFLVLAALVRELVAAVRRASAHRWRCSAPFSRCGCVASCSKYFLPPYLVQIENDSTPKSGWSC